LEIHAVHDEREGHGKGNQTHGAIRRIYGHPVIIVDV
jgi:hypothetical protein